MDTYDLVATAAVVAMPVSVVALVIGAMWWARDALDRQPRVGVVGILATAAATGNLLLERPLGGRTTRPLLALFLEQGGAFRSALLALAIVVLLVSATSVAVRLATR